MKRISRHAWKGYFFSTSLTLLALLASGFFHSLHAQTIYALSSNNLISFDAQMPSMLLTSVPVSGIAAGQELAGMDFRPNTGELYALGYHIASGQMQLYTLNLTTGAATAVGSSAMLNPGIEKIGFDFNPTVDRIRVTGSDNSNYRLHPVTGALVATDGSLAFAATDPNNSANPSIGAVAYTNSYIGATSTTLYNYDDSLNVLTSQIPPNNGVLNTIGNAGIMVNLNDPSADMDIWFDPVSRMNITFLTANTGTSVSDDLYMLDLTTGAATFIGTIGNGVAVQDVAAYIDRTVTSDVTGSIVYAITANNNLVTFDSDQPQIIRTIAPLSGIASTQTAAGLDVRPATGELYTIGYNPTSGEAQLYILQPSTGVAVAVAPPVMLAPNMGKIGFDFNPVVDRIRVTGSNNNNFRMHPVTGALVATDGSLSFATGDVNAGINPSIGTVAYTNSFKGTTATTLYNYDDSLNVFTTQIPPNSGTLNTIGSSGITVNPADMTSDLDVWLDPTDGTNVAFFAANTGNASSDVLYTVNLASGSVTPVGFIGYGIAIRDIAARIDTAACILSVTNVAVVDESCPGFANGSITISALSNGGQIIYSINGGASFSLSGQFQNLSPGNYNVFVQLQNAPTCSSSQTVVIEPGSPANLKTWFQDVDNDGYSNGQTLQSCDQPAGYQLAANLIATAGDCDDTDPLQFPGQTWYKDSDNDHYSDGTTLVQCVRPAGYKVATQLMATTGDCNDSNSSINPGALEVCNGMDDNCDGLIDNGLPSQVFNGNVTFSTQAQVNAFSACYTAINGNLTIQNAGITNLATLSNLVKVTGHVKIITTGLTTLSWLANLDTIGGSLLIKTNQQLVTLNGLENLKKIGSYLSVYFNFKLADCCAIQTLLSTPGAIGGAKAIYRNNSGCDSISDINTVCNNSSIVLPAVCPTCPAARNEANMEMAVAPNPAKGFFFVHTAATTKGTIQVFDVTGKEVKRVQVNPSETLTRIETADLIPGLHVIVFKTENSVLSAKIAVE